MTTYLTLDQMSKQEMEAQLRKIGYDGPTSYLKPKLRSILDNELGRRGMHASQISGPEAGATTLPELTGTVGHNRTASGQGEPAGKVATRAVEAFLFRTAANQFAITAHGECDDLPYLLKDLAGQVDSRGQLRRILDGMARRGLLIRDEVNGGACWQIPTENEEAQGYDEAQCADLMARIVAGTA